jgi:hypothetical protein
VFRESFELSTLSLGTYFPLLTLLGAMHRLPLILVLLLAFATGCNNRKTQQLAFGTREVQLMDGYYSADVKTAERSLLEMDSHLRQGQLLQIEKRDYDYTLGLVHGRLALLYQHVGRSADAEAEFKKALSHLSKQSGTDEQKRQDLVSLITVLDQNREVKWRTKP